MNWQQLQDEHRIWVDTVYPGQPAWLPAAGLVEEAGELMHSFLKRYQRNTWGEEARYAGVVWTAEVVDAIGDCAIYAVSLCNASGWPAERAFDAVPALPGTHLGLAASLVKQAADVALTPSLYGLRDFVSILRAIARAEQVDFDSAVSTTWAEVRARRREGTRIESLKPSQAL